MTEVTKPVEVSSKGKGWLYAIIAAGGLLVYSFVTGSNPLALFKFSSGGWFIAGLLTAAFAILAGEILIKKQALTGTAEKTARLVSIILGLVIATMTVVNVWTWGTPNFGGANAVMQSLINIFTLPTMAVIALMGIILNGLYWEVKEGSGTISKMVFRVAITLLIFGALVTWLIGEQLMIQSGTALQNGARSQLSAWLSGQQPTSGFDISLSSLALGFLALFFVFGLIRYEIIKKTTGLAATILILPLIVWFAWGALPAQFKQDVRDVTSSITPNFIQITPAQREAARLREAEERALAVEAERERIINEAVALAAAEAEAAKYRPLTTAAFTTRTAGTFEPIQIKSGNRIGPIYMYAACDTNWTKTGMGMLKILTRPDAKSEPVEATLTDRGYGIKQTGHAGLPEAMFFEAVQGDIQIELSRFDNGTNLENPC